MPWEYRKSFTVKIEMTSDWHIGSGNSRGDIDSLVQKDRDGLPYIPAKTLTGILRDSAELVAMGLDSGEPNGIWQQWVDVIFGDQPALAQSPTISPPRPAALSIRSAHLLESLKQALISKPKLKEAICFIKPGVAIDLTSGCAKNDFLRFEEMVRKGTILEAQECQLTLPPTATEKQKKIAYALLIAAAKMVERIGGKRRRGSGLCKITIDSEAQSCLQWLSKQENHLTPPDYVLEIEPVNTNVLQKAANEWHCLKFKITALSPLVINSRTVGNVVETLDYLPGKYLLPILHTKLGQFININEAIAKADIIVTNATIAIEDKPSRPTPFCLSADKLKGSLEKGFVYNLLVEPEPEGIQLKGIRGGYIGEFSAQNLPVYQKVDKLVYTHNTIKDKVQRPTEDLGGIYSYEAIAPGTIFQGEIKIKQNLANSLTQKNQKHWERLNGKYRIGQSKKDDYGLIKLTVTEPPRPLAQNIPTANNVLFVWLLSDVLLRDVRLRPTADLDELRQQLEIALSVKLKPRENESLISLSARQTRSDSWQTRWGLARPTLAGLQAGTTIVYQVEGTLDPTLIKKVQVEGIGERRAEGYGQLCFNDLLLTSTMSGQQSKNSDSNATNKPTSNNTVIKPKDKGFNYGRIIEIAAWKGEIERQALAIAANKAKRREILGIEIIGDESRPPMSQLGGLRSKILKLQKIEDKNEALAWLKALKDSNRQDKWPKGSLELIKNLIEHESEIWNHLMISDDLTLTQNGEPELKQKIWAEAVKTLIDACIRAHKRDWEKTQPTNAQATQSQTSERA